MQSAWSRIWTRVTVSISYDNNHYTTGQLLIGYQSYGGQIYLSDEIKHIFFMSILLYGCTTWTLTKCIEKKLEGHLPPIQVHRTRHAGHCCRSKDKLISDVLHWTLSQGQASLEWLARIYLQQLCADPKCSLEDQPDMMDNIDEWQERVWEIHARGTTSWWWWWCYF